ncbi:unnamed protein product, partial [Brassica oleracea var. botrytis]
HSIYLLRGSSRLRLQLVTIKLGGFSPVTIASHCTPTTLHRNSPQSCMLRMLPYSPVSSSLFSAAAHRNLSRATKPSPSFALPTVL